MDFNGESLKDRLAGKLIGGTVHFLPEIDSTNDYAFKLAQDNAPEGAIVVADRQTRGRGRLNRVWQSPSSKNIYASIILRPPVEPAVAPQITLVAGVAVAETLSSYCPGRVAIKWPNDVLIGGKKACGILTEMKTSGKGVEFVIVGIGINVNIRTAELDESFRAVSTSLTEETGRSLSRLDVMAKLCENMDKYYHRFVREGFSAIRLLWLEKTDMVGMMVRVAFQEDIKSGRVTGIDHDGALLLTDEKGESIRIIAGDASIVKE